MSPSGSRAASRLRTPLRGSKRRSAARQGRFAALPCFARALRARASLRDAWGSLRSREMAASRLKSRFSDFGAKITLKKTDLKRKKLKFSKNLFTPLKVIHRRVQPQSLSSELQKLIELCPKNPSKIIIIIIKNGKETARKSKKPIFHKIFFSPLK